MGILRFPDWQKPCEDAFLEPDPEKLFMQVIVAETAIFHRLHKLTTATGETELHAMDEALKHLQYLLENTFILPTSVESAGIATGQTADDGLKAQKVKRQSQPSASCG
jgi:hypothetical protein